VARINVFLDDVKCEIVKPAKTPDRQREQHGGPQRRAVEKKQNGCDDPDEQKQQSLQFDPKRIRQIFHKFQSHAEPQSRKGISQMETLRLCAFA
jgi:hypothetical protein